jgi:ABC-type transporter Mla subunit MlaD
MINEAAQHLNEKLAQRDKVIQATKTWLRQVDTKTKNIDGHVVNLLKMVKQVDSHHSQIKVLQGSLEQLQSEREYEQQAK